MAEKKRDWYGSKKKGEEGKKDGPESMPERHARERHETHERHAKARDDMHGQHEDEIQAMQQRQSDEMQQAQGAPGGQAEPGAMNNAAAGAAPETPPAVAGANAA